MKIISREITTSGPGRRHGGFAGIVTLGHRRGHRHYRGIGPSLGGLNFFRGEVSGMDLLVGAGIGLAGAAVLNLAITNVSALAPLSTIAGYGPAAGSILGGAAAWFVMRKKNLSKAKGLFAGAVTVGVAATLWDNLKGKFPGFQDIVRLNMGRYGYIMRNPIPANSPFRGMGYLINNPARPALPAPSGVTPTLKRLGQLSMDGHDGYADVDELLGMVG